MLPRQGTTLRSASAAMAALFFSQSTGVAQVASRALPAGSRLPAGALLAPSLQRPSLPERMPDVFRPAPENSPRHEAPAARSEAPAAALPLVRRDSPSAAESFADAVEDGLLWLAFRQAEGAAALDALHEGIERGMLALALLQHRAGSQLEAAGADFREGLRLWRAMAAAREEEESSSLGRNPFPAAPPGEAAASLPLEPPSPSPSGDRMLMRWRPRPMPLGVSAFALPGGSRIPLLRFRCETPAMPRFEGKWREKNGLRFRVNYLDPIGTIQLTGLGMHYTIGGRSRYVGGIRAPFRYHGTYPVYWPEAVVRYQIELENALAKPLKRLRVAAVQENFNPAGSAGRIVGEASSWQVPSLKAGERTMLEGVLRMSTPEQGRTGAFEQTHLTVVEGTPGFGARELLDAPQAGIVDPPDGLN